MYKIKLNETQLNLIKYALKSKIEKIEENQKAIESFGEKINDLTTDYREILKYLETIPF